MASICKKHFSIFDLLLAKKCILVALNLRVVKAISLILKIEIDYLDGQIHANAKCYLLFSLNQHLQNKH